MGLVTDRPLPFASAETTAFTHKEVSMERVAKLFVRDLMTSNVVRVTASDPIKEAERLMIVSDIRHLPVVGKGSEIVGILSDRDLSRGRAKGLSGTDTVDRTMTAPCVTVRPDQPAHEAVGILIRRKIGALPVIDREGHLVGMITETDFLAVAHEALREVTTSVPTITA
jgi:CBS domain-containing protein